MALNFNKLHSKKQFKSKKTKDTLNTIPFNHSITIDFSNLKELPVSKKFNYLVNNNFDLNDLCFFDTETTGLSGGAGTVIFLAGIGFFDNKKFVVKQFFIDNPGKEVLLIENLRKIMERKKAVISYNGKCFDVPLLHSRAVMNRVKKVKVENQIDLLHISRFIWKSSLPNCKLTTIERKVLNINRTDEDIPGNLIPGAYRDFLLRRDDTQIKKIIYHNREDIVSLARVYLYLLEKSYRLDDFSVNFAIAKKMFSLSEYDSCLEMLRKTLDSSTFISVEKKKEIFWLASLCLKKQKKFKEASKLWEILKTNQAYLELAKYYEHKEKNYSKAKNVTEILLAYSKGKNSQKLIHRLNRLNAKLQVN